MKIKKTGLAFTMCCLGSLAATNVSWAAFTQIQIAAVNGTGMSSAAYSSGSLLNSTTWAGSWTATIVNPQPGGYAVLPSPLVPGFTFTAFCTDLGNANANGTYNYEALAFSSAGLATPDGVPPDPDWANSGSGQRAAWLYNTKIGLVTDANSRAAMCIAIWEALYEGSGTFDVRYRGANDGGSDNNTGRTFKATGSSTVQTLANSWLADGVAAGFAGYDYTWFAERQTPDVQSLVGPTTPIPEPTTVIAGALLLLPFGMSTLRMVRRSRAA